MNCTEVQTEKDKRDFLQVAPLIYKNDDQWVRPLDKDIEEVFDARKNKSFRNGEAARWILKNGQDELIGRVAAFVNYKTAASFEQPTGAMGFFECINNSDAAFLLFDKCKTWLQARGMEAMDGPVNFGEKNRWWGLLVDGFFLPVYGMNYNPVYYRDFFEQYGFQTYFEQYYYLFKVKQQIPEKYRERSERIMRNNDYYATHINKKELEKYTEDFRTIYNKAWGNSYRIFKPMAKAQARQVINSLKPLLDENIVWFAYYKDEPIAFFIMLPEINQIFKLINNGKFGLIEKLRFTWLRWQGACRKMSGLVFGVVPEFQGRGVEGYIIMAAAKHIQPMNKYDELEMTWIGDFNPKMVHLVESLGTQKVRTAITYRKLFDESKPFKRAETNV